ncbi:hypothetical protein DY000_02046659 [Brassica cretica]|uniref:Uncharacterized protein n=1 Tax=Brassica cretica TaxID=69181 RepID=A0ABQ7F384_BRACR|nr:hypothetical protein DY000_02046659 [Brassica cretica]
MIRTNCPNATTTNLTLRSSIGARSLRSDRALARAWSLRSDRVGRTFGRYAAADIGPDLVAT